MVSWACLILAYGDWLYMSVLAEGITCLIGLCLQAWPQRDIVYHLAEYDQCFVQSRCLLFQRHALGSRILQTAQTFFL